MGRFLIKWAVNGIIVVTMLMWLTEASFWGASFAASILCILAYLIGDQLILRASNNAIATIADAVLTVAYLWIVADAMNWSLTTGELLSITAVLSVAEVIYHRYLAYLDRQTA